MRPPRVPGFSYVGLRRYFLTICVRGRRPVFISHETVSAVLAHFRQSAERHGFDSLAYCFMPDHVHLVCQARTAVSDFGAFVHDAKQRSSYAFKRSTAERLWQDGYYDHVLRDEDKLLSVVRYVLSNPVRAGLARAIGEYPFCGSDLYSMDEICACGEMWTPRQRRP
jgi:putative transposase